VTCEFGAVFTNTTHHLQLDYRLTRQTTYFVDRAILTGKLTLT